MAKRTITFIGVTHKRTKTYNVTIKPWKFPLPKTVRFRKYHIQTDSGYHDVTVEMDRWFRLRSVKIESSR